MRIRPILPAALVITVLLVPRLGAASSPSPPLDIMEQRMQACVACHGKEGRATSTGYFPRIAGKPAGYLYNQLVNFREGRRKNATMGYLVANMSDAYLREIAEYFSRLDLPYAPPATASADSTSQTVGAKLARNGDPARELPACVQCHGKSLTGVSPAIPGLLGLSRDYLLSQFGAWRTGQRAAAAPDCMAKIARAMSSDEVTAVASWLSSQAVPSPASPEPLPSAKLPMQCGSGLR